MAMNKRLYQIEKPGCLAINPDLNVLFCANYSQIMLTLFSNAGLPASIPQKMHSIKLWI